MPRKLIQEYPLFDVEQCPAENIRIYRVRGLRLYDEQEEKNRGPVIDLVRSLPGVAQATFKNCHAFIVRRSLRVTWQDAEPQIVNLLRGVTICSDGFSPRKEINADFSEEQFAKVGVAILRSADRRLL